MKNIIVLVSIFLIYTVVSICVSAQTKEITAEFKVLDENGNFVSNLKSVDVSVSAGKISSLKLKTDNALEVAIMIDASASQEKTLPLERKAAESFIDIVLNSAKDKVSIVKFSGSISLVQDLTADFQKSKEQIGKIKFEPPPGYIGGGIVAGNAPPKKNQTAQGSTSLWGSTKQILEAFSKMDSSNSKKAIIVITDGVNTYGDETLAEVIELSIKSKIPVYAIGIGDDFYDGVDEKNLKKITEATGGISITPKKNLKNLQGELKFIEQSMRSYYEFAFVTNLLGLENLKDKTQDLKIEIINPDLRTMKLRIIQPKIFYIPE